MEASKGLRTMNETENDASNLYRSVLGIPLRKGIITAVVAVFILFITFVCTYLILRTKPTKMKYIDTYSGVFSFASLNSSADPCSNFYEFTCGRWHQSQDSDSTLHNTNAFSTLQNVVNKRQIEIFKNAVPSSNFPRIVNDALHFYNSCVSLNNRNSSDFKYILTTFDNIGGWPILQSEIWNESNFEWVSTSLYLLKNLAIDSVFGIEITIDDYDPSSNIISITVPKLESEVFSLRDSSNEEMLYVLLYNLNSEVDYDVISQDVVNLRNIEAAWRDLIEGVNKSDPARITLRDLQREVLEIDFVNYLNLFLKDTADDAGFTVSEKDTVLVENLNYLKKVVSLFSSDAFSKRDLANMFGWIFARNSLILIPNTMKKYAEHNQYDLQEVLELIENNCYEKTFENYECAFNYLFIQNVSHEGVADSKIIFQHLKKAFSNLFTTSKWLDDSTRKAAIQKLTSFRAVLGFESIYLQRDKFDEIYEGFPSVSKDVFETFYEIKKYYVSQSTSVFKSPRISFLDYHLLRPVKDVSAYYAPQKNLLVIPLSLFSSPFYYKSAPWYLNFGAIGTVIGHEMMHAFDKYGSLRDENGRVHNWWTNKSTEIYNRYSECFKEQLLSYSGSNSSVPASSTINENMADTEGLRIAFKAYKEFAKENILGGEYPHLEQYSPDQMFFISYGTIWCTKKGSESKSISGVHSSPEFRVNSAVLNSEYFAQTFKCSEKSLMNLSTKCALWN